MSAGAGTLALLATGAVEDFPVAMAWAPDSSALAIGGGEGRIWRIEARTGGATPLGEHAPGVLELAWQPKGQLLASAGQDGSVRLWNTQEPDAAAQVLHRATRWPAGVAWQADGARLAFAHGRAILLFNNDGSPAGELDGHEAPLTHLAWRGRDELVAAGNGALFVDRISSGEIEQFVLEGTPQTLALSPDLKVAANGLADGSVNFRYINNRKRSRMSGYAGKVHQTAWSANSRFLATASTGASSIVVWDFGGKGPEGSEPLQLEVHEERIEALAWQAGGALLAACGRDWKLSLWKPGPRRNQVLDVQALDGEPCAIGWSPDGRGLAVAQASGKIRLYVLAA
jgi:WD40 repeat protein